jgi:glycosyltransferase involved in cell wall biosynthesis
VTSVHHARDVRIYRKIARTLAAAGYDVVVVHPDGDIPPEGGVRFSGINLRTGRLGRLLVGGFAVFRRARSLGAVVFHFHDPEIIPWGVLWRLLGGIAIYDVHEDVAKGVAIKTWLPRILRLPLALAAKIAEWGAGWLCSGVVAATAPIGRHFPAHRTIVVRNFPDDPAQFRRHARRWDLRRNEVLYTGTLTPDRGLHLMIDAIGMVAPAFGATLVLAGPLRDQIIADRHGKPPAQNLLRYEGVVPRERILQLVGAARIGIHVVRPLPHFVESLPIKIFEYMAAGIPVIVSDFPEWRRMIVAHNCGLVVEADRPEELARAIETLLADSERAEAMGERGREAVLRHYDWASEAPRLLDFYRSIIGEYGASHFHLRTDDADRR